jgi:hypothetical protein
LIKGVGFRKGRKTKRRRVRVRVRDCVYGYVIGIGYVEWAVEGGGMSGVVGMAGGWVVYLLRRNARKSRQ